jgi:hypothetical protein
LDQLQSIPLTGSQTNCDLALPELLLCLCVASCETDDCGDFVSKICAGWCGPVIRVYF